MDKFGPINKYLVQAGIIDSPIYWLTDSANPWIPRLTILGIGLWLGIPIFHGVNVRNYDINPKRYL